MKQGYGVGAAGMGGLALGAGLMYLMDPDWGRRRRHVARDKAVRRAHQVRAGATRTAGDVGHRARGLGARLRHLGQHLPPDDRVLEQRVRARLGRLCTHSHAIDVFAEDGVVELSGPILSSEVRRVLHGVGCVVGVKRVVSSQLELHEHAGNLPSLQGGRPAWQYGQSWSPAARFLAGLAGVGFLATSRRLPTPWCHGAGVLGLGLILRSLSSRALGRWISSGQRESIHLEKIFEVSAPVSEVFALWSKFEEFPRFLSHVKEVRRAEDGKTHWEVTGPAGSTVAWTAELTRYVPNRLIAWRSLPGAPIETYGEVRFRPTAFGTRVELLMSYRPPAGSVGHALAALLGANPKKQIDDDMVRFKSLLEVGKATGRSETVTRDEVIPPIGRPTPVED